MIERIRIGFVERKFSYFVSLETVFREVAAALDKTRFETCFSQLPYLNSLFGTLKNLLFFRPDKTAHIYHVTGHCHYISLILPPERTVLTIHDLGFLHTQRGLRRFVLKKILLDLPIKRLKYITVVSQATKDELLTYFQDKGTIIRVIGNPLDTKLIASEKRVFNSECPNILQVGTSPNKNVNNLIRALDGMSCRLTLIGELTEETRTLLDAAKIAYEVKSALEPQELRQEYEKADLVAFCSFYEGFGLPVIEAQAMLTPLVTSNISPLTDVAGQGAVFADPHDHRSIRESIRRVIDDAELRQRLTEAGLENIRRFDGSKIAAQYAQLYEEIISTK